MSNNWSKREFGASAECVPLLGGEAVGLVRDSVRSCGRAQVGSGIWPTDAELVEFPMIPFALVMIGGDEGPISAVHQLVFVGFVFVEEVSREISRCSPACLDFSA